MVAETSGRSVNNRFCLEDRRSDIWCQSLLQHLNKLSLSLSLTHTHTLSLSLSLSLSLRYSILCLLPRYAPTTRNKNDEVRWMGPGQRRRPLPALCRNSSAIVDKNCFHFKIEIGKEKIKVNSNAMFSVFKCCRRRSSSLLKLLSNFWMNKEIILMKSCSDLYWNHQKNVLTADLFVRECLDSEMLKCQHGPVFSGFTDP